jgi:hypothetical protein
MTEQRAGARGYSSPWNSAAHEPRCDMTGAAAIIPPDGMRHYCLVYATERQYVRRYQYLEGSRCRGVHLTLDGDSILSGAHSRTIK